jgi:hypothetical protein
MPDKTRIHCPSFPFLCTCYSHTTTMEVLHLKQKSTNIIQSAFFQNHYKRSKIFKITKNSSLIIARIKHLQKTATILHSKFSTSHNSSNPFNHISTRFHYNNKWWKNCQKIDEICSTRCNYQWKKSVQTWWIKQRDCLCTRVHATM